MPRALICLRSSQNFSESINITHARSGREWGCRKKSISFLIEIERGIFLHGDGIDVTNVQAKSIFLARVQRLTGNTDPVRHEGRKYASCEVQKVARCDK